eukprot:3360660-Alexandrium_andersonii.AAC.1
MGEQELVEVHQRALSATVAYLRGVGATISEKKSYTAATQASARAMLTRAVAQGCSRPFEVLHDCRDLGSHLNTT